MNVRAFIILMLVFLMPGTAFPAETGVTIKPAELKSEPFADAQTVATLPEASRVEILKRQGAWMQVKATEGQGWLRMLSVRLGDAAPPQKAGGGIDSGVATLLGLKSGAAPGSTTVATGVRGLSEEDLKNAQPNPGELEKMHQFAVNGTEARNFSESAKLSPQSVAYPAAPIDPQKGKPGSSRESSQ